MGFTCLFHGKGRLTQQARQEKEHLFSDFGSLYILFWGSFEKVRLQGSLKTSCVGLC